MAEEAVAVIISFGRVFLSLTVAGLTRTMHCIFESRCHLTKSFGGIGFQSLHIFLVTSKTGIKILASIGKISRLELGKLFVGFEMLRIGRRVEY